MKTITCDKCGTSESASKEEQKIQLCQFIVCGKIVLEKDLCPECREIIQQQIGGTNAV